MVYMRHIDRPRAARHGWWPWQTMISPVWPHIWYDATQTSLLQDHSDTVCVSEELKDERWWEDAGSPCPASWLLRTQTPHGSLMSSTLETRYTTTSLWCWPAALLMKQCTPAAAYLFKALAESPSRTHRGMFQHHLGCWQDCTTVEEEGGGDWNSPRLKYTV